MKREIKIRQLVMTPRDDLLTCMLYIHGVDADQFGFETPDKAFVIIARMCRILSTCKQNVY